MFNLSNNVAEIKVSYHPETAINPVIKSVDDATKYLLPFFPEDTIALQERMVVGYLNRANQLLGVYEVSVGGITGTNADPRLILSVALKVAATGLILMHNHPSGNLRPSNADITLTLKLRESCEMLQISLLDHLIVAPGGKYYSMVEHENM